MIVQYSIRQRETNGVTLPEDLWGYKISFVFRVEENEWWKERAQRGEGGKRGALINATHIHTGVSVTYIQARVTGSTQDEQTTCVVIV